MPRRPKILLIALLVAACTPAHPERLARDVDRYLGVMQTWAPVEVETNRAIQRLLATQFVDDAEVLRQLSDSRPRVKRHLHVLLAYHPETLDVQGVHREYVESWRALLRGYSQLQHGIEEADANSLATGREALLEWRRSLRTVARDLGDLAALSRPSR